MNDQEKILFPIDNSLQMRIVTKALSNALFAIATINIDLSVSMVFLNTETSNVEHVVTVKKFVHEIFYEGEPDNIDMNSLRKEDEIFYQPHGYESRILLKGRDVVNNFLDFYTKIEEEIRIIRFTD